jgi:hypothetical protein
MLDALAFRTFPRLLPGAVSIDRGLLPAAAGKSAPSRGRLWRIGGQ